MIVPHLDEYVRLMQFEPGAEAMYLFHVGIDLGRNLSSSQWTQCVKVNCID